MRGDTGLLLIDLELQVQIGAVVKRLKQNWSNLAAEGDHGRIMIVVEMLDMQFGGSGRAPQKESSISISNPPSERILVDSNTNYHHHRRGTSWIMGWDNGKSGFRELVATAQREGNCIHVRRYVLTVP